MFKILSHACLNVKYKNSNLLIDPWLVGSCYWRSWWNYPPLDSIDFENLNPQYIYITHVHWDHWHGPSLKKFLNKNITILTHDEPNKRSYNDLKAFGFEKVKLLKHGETFDCGDIKITPYQFGLFLNDSALVIETDEYKILDANDCKIAGASLDQIKKRHGNFDFALRSHSSANDRVCYHVKGEEKKYDDASHYSRAFKLFMQNVKAKYSVPFASNHCHLHKDTLHFNDIINNPLKLQGDIEKQGGLEGSELKIMLPGDSWHPKKGFTIDSNKLKYFDKAKATELIQQYASTKEEKLAAYYQRENRAKVRSNTLKLFEKQLEQIPRFFKRKLKGWKIGFIVFSEQTKVYLEVAPYESSVKKVDENDFNYDTVVKMPVLIFRDAIHQKMFHHSSIAKRNTYNFDNKEELAKWEVFNSLFEKIEFEVFPLKASYIKNIILSYFRRWREILVYFKAFLLLKKGHKIYEVEEIILED
jgi:UDP-MurNAc hydroxylase